MLGRIIYRFKQFWVGMFCRYSSADAAFAHSYLNIQEMALFTQLPGFEKKHAVVVAKKMLEAARLAPSGSNRQPWRFQIVKDPSQRERIYREATFGDKHILEAPVMIVCGSELLSFVKGHKLAPPGSEYFGANSKEWDDIKQFIPDANLYTSIAVEHMVLAATALGLGTCWVGAFDPLAAREILGLPDEVEPIAFTPLGYSDDQPKEKIRKPISELVHYEHW